jgi:hypothetical protein
MLVKVQIPEYLFGGIKKEWFKNSVFSPNAKSFYFNQTFFLNIGPPSS